MTAKKKSVKTSKKDGASSREIRDRLTRVKDPIKGKDTQARQWRRWSP
jgi:hypothetical protein